MSSSTGPRSIFEYDNYRQFLADAFRARKQENKNFSYRFFARQAGIHAHSFVIRVLQGKVDLSEETIEKFAQALKLRREEAQFFRRLVLFNQAKTSDGKAKLAKEILSSRTHRKIHPLMEAHFRFFANWYYPPIRELVCLPEFQEDEEWIARRVIPCITPLQARKALTELIQLGLLIRNEQGKLVQADSIISTQDEVTSAAVAEYHKQMMKRASESIDRVPGEKRAIMGQTLGLSEASAGKIKEIIKRFRQEVFEVVSEETTPTSVYQLNFQLFPLILPDHPTVAAPAAGETQENEE